MRTDSGTFYRCVDRDGKIPRHMSYPATRYFVRYMNNVPIAVSPYPGQDTVYDYQSQSFLSLVEGKLDYKGRPMPLFTGLMLDN
jgi:hypothetical protein